MRISKSLLACLALTAVAPAASAQYLGSPFSYNYLDVSYVKSEIDSRLPNLDGFRTRMSYDSPEQARLLLEYETTEEIFSGVAYKRQDLVIGAGFISSQNASMDMLLDFKYLRGERSVNGSNLTKSGYGVELGVRGLVTSMLELDASVEYRQYWIAEFGVRAGVQFQFSDAFSIGALYSVFETETKLSAGLRYSM